MTLAGGSMEACDKHPALPLLGGGEVDFKDAELGEGVAAGEGIEARAEDHVLAQAGGDGLGEMVFGVAAAGGHEAAEVAGHGVGSAFEIALIAGADEADGDGIVEDGRMVHELVRGAADGDAECGAAGFAVLHGVRLQFADRGSQLSVVSFQLTVKSEE